MLSLRGSGRRQVSQGKTSVRVRATLSYKRLSSLWLFGALPHISFVRSSMGSAKKYKARECNRRGKMGLCEWAALKMRGLQNAPLGGWELRVQRMG